MADGDRDIQTNLEGYDGTSGFSDITGLIDNLQADDHSSKLNALRVLEQEADENPESAKEAFPYLVPLLDSRYPLIRNSASRIVRDLAKHSPDEALPHVPELIDCLSRDDQELVDNVVEALAEAAENSSRDIHVSFDDLSQALESGGETRAKAYQILGKTASREDLKELVERAEYEPGFVGKACRDAIQETKERSLDQLESESSEVRRAGMENIHYLVRNHSDESDIPVDRLLGALKDDVTAEMAASSLKSLGRDRSELISEVLPALVDLFEHEVAGRYASDVFEYLSVHQSAAAAKSLPPVLPDLISHLIDDTGYRYASNALSTIADRDRSAAEAIASELASKLDQADARERILRVLTDIGKSEPAAVNSVVEEVLPYIDEGTDIVRSRSLQVLKHAVRSGYEIEDSTTRQILGYLDEESDRVRRSACEVLGFLDIYPPPKELEEIQEKYPEAEQAIHRLNQSYQAVDLKRAPEREGSRVLGLIEGGYLKYYSGGNEWWQTRVGTLEQRILSQVASQYADSGNANIVLPYLAPEIVLLVVLELLCQELENEPHVVLMSPVFGNTWGTKEDIKKEYNSYGVSGDEERTFSASRFADIIPTARVSDDGEIILDSSGSRSGRLTICKRFDELEEAEDATAVVLNLTTRFKQEFPERISDLAESFSGTPVFSIYSLFTRCYQPQSYDRYKPPIDLIDHFDTIPLAGDIQAADEAVEDDRTRLDEAGLSDTPHRRVIDQLDGLLTAKSVEIETIEHENLVESFQQLYEESQELLNSPAEDVANQVFYRRMFFKHVPVPLRYYDEMARQKQIDGAWYAPDTSVQLLTAIENADEDYELPYLPAIIRDVMDEFRTVQELLQDENPKYDALKRIIDSELNSSHKVGVFFSRNSWQEGFLHALRSEHQIESEDLRQHGVRLYKPNTIGEMDEVNKLVFPNMVPPQFGGFYLHPNARQVHVLTYGDTWTGLVEKRIGDFIEDLNAIYGVDEDDLFPEPAVSVSSTVVEEQQRRKTEPAEIDEETALMQTFWRHMANKEREYSESDRDIEYKTYIITTEQGEELHLNSRDSVLLHREEDVISRGEFEWIRVDSLTVDDEFVLIPDELRRKLLHRELEKMYEDEIGEDVGVFEGLKIWYNALEEIESDYDSYSEIYRKLKDAGISIKYHAVRDWFSAVRNSESYLDLVENQDLRIGPQNPGDIRIVGQVFDIDRLQSKADEVGATLATFRQRNRERGKDVNETIKEMMADSEGNIVKDGAETYIVSDIRIK